MSQNKKWLDISIGGAGILAWLLFRLFLNAIWDYFRLPVQESWPVPLPEILAFIVGLVVFLALKKNGKVNEFGGEVVSELGKVTWPTRKETLVSTGVIIVMVGIAAVLLFVFDTIWGTLTRSFLEL